MKKILLILSATTIFATGTSSMIGIAYNNNYSDLKTRTVKLYSEVAAYAMRSAILTDINRINPDWSSSYNYLRKISDAMPWIIDEKSKITIDTNDSLMTRLYETTFGIDDFSFQKEENLKVSPNTNLDKFRNNEALDGAMIAPDVNTKTTIGLISGILNTVFGSGINSQTMSMILGFLDKDFIKNAIVSPETETIFQTINQFLNFQGNDETQQAITKVVNALTEKEVAINDQTFKEVLQQDSNLIFKALLIFINNQTIKGEDDNTIDYSAIFFNKLSGTNDERLVESTTTDMIEAISYTLKFFNSFSRYLAQYDKYRPYSSNLSAPNKLFDDKKTNKEVVDEILNKKYKPGPSDPNDPTWFKTKNEEGNDVYYSVINLQDFIANLQYYLIPDPINDPNGINLRKLLLIIFNNGEKEINPISNVIIKNGIGKILSDLLKNALQDSADMVGRIIKIIIGSDEQNFSNIIGDAVNWLILKIINNEDLTKLIDQLGLITGFLPDGEFKIVFQNLIAYKNTARGKAYLSQPFNALYNGQLLPDLLGILSPALSSDFDVAAYGQLENIQKMLTMNLGDLLKIFGVGDLPDILYAFNSTSITDFVNKIAEPFEIDHTKNGATYLNHFWNTQDLESIINQLSSIKSGVYNKDNEQISIILPLYNLIIAGNRNLNSNVEADQPIIEALQGITLVRQGFSEPIRLLNPIQNQENTYRVTSGAINLLLGLNQEKLEFIPETILHSLSRLYGTNYSQEEYDLNQHLLNDETKENLSGHDFDAMYNATTTLIQKVVNQVFVKFTNDSVNDLIDDKYAYYFNDNNFKITNLNDDGFDINSNVFGQKIEFDLTYTDPNTKKNYTYHLYMTKGKYGAYQGEESNLPTAAKYERGFIIREFILTS